MNTPSPCIGLCQLDANGVFCRGCRRTLPEIKAWCSLTGAEKRAVLDRVQKRESTAPARQVC